MKKKIIFLIFLIILASALATTIYIPEDYATIQEGIDASEDGDEIIVSPGTYVENINFNGKAIVLGSLFYTTQDTSYISQTIIDGNQDGTVVSFESEEDSNSVLTGFTITNGHASFGGGIYCSESSPSLENVTITGNSTEYRGGGIYFFNCSPSLENVTITNNSADRGGGIYFSYSNPVLENVTITDNSAEENGGGIYCYGSSPVLSSENRCNIYLNNTNNRGNGSDIYSDTNISVIVDTFTVLNPTDFHAAPIENFSFDILHGLQEQINADLYVSPTGNNANTGLTIDDPFQTIQHACSVIFADSLNLHTIHLAEGTYSPSINGEFFPVSIPSYVSLTGEDEDTVILDAEGTAGVIKLMYAENVIISDLTITNGVSSYGGGIECRFNSSPSLTNLTITGNSADYSGGGIYCYESNPSIENVTITGNSAVENGGGVCCSSSCPSLENVTISDNLADGDFASGGGIYCSSSNPSIVNVTITDNSALGDESKGGGVFCSSSNPSLENVTISDNSTDGNSCFGGGIYCGSDSNPILVNCIFWNNSPHEVEFSTYSNPNIITIAYCDIAGGEEGIETNDNGTVNWLEGNIDADPLFVDVLEDDYNLTADSPCIDAGTSFFEYEGEVLVDLSEEEYYGAAPDIGANESPFTSNETDEIEPLKDCVTIYPNPFNPETTISFFTTEVTEKTEISIYNLKGQKVITLVNEVFDAGSHTVIWNASDQSSGVYFLRFESDDQHETRKLILLK